MYVSVGVGWGGSLLVTNLDGHLDDGWRPLSLSMVCHAVLVRAAPLPACCVAALLQVCWSFTKLGYHARGVVDQALVLLVEATPRFSDKAVSNVLWSLATLCHPLPKRAGQAPLDRVAASLQVPLPASAGCPCLDRTCMLFMPCIWPGIGRGAERPRRLCYAVCARRRPEG